MDPDETLRLIRTHLEAAKRDRDRDNEDVFDQERAMLAVRPLGLPHPRQPRQRAVGGRLPDTPRFLATARHGSPCRARGVEATRLKRRPPMSEERTVTVFQFSELSDQAKEKARSWYRDGALYDDWWDSVYDDAAQIADILGIDLRQKPVKLMNGSTRYEPAIYFSGFSSQGDGACFEGSYSYKKGCVEALKGRAPKNEELRAIARALVNAQRPHLYGLSATVKHRGHYSHAFCTEIEVFDRGGNYASTKAAEEISEALRGFMHWIYRSLEKEYEWLMSDEQVDASIEANEYEFTEDGDRYRY